GRRLVERRGGGNKRGVQEKAVHAFGLPRGEQSKPTHREATAGRLAPFLGSAESCCTASSGWTPAPRAAGRSLLRGSCERADLHSRGASHEERVGGGGGSGSRGQHVVDQADPGPEDLPGRCERAADAALARCAVASYLLPRLTYTTEQRRYRQAEAFRGAVREQPRLIVPALAQPVRVERNGHQDVRLWHRAGFEQHGQRSPEILALFVLEAMDGVRQRPAVQVRRARERKSRRVRAAVRAPARLQCRKQRFILGNSAHRAAGGGRHESLRANGAKG